MSLEDTTGVFSGLPQLALTLIGSFVLVLSVLRAFGCIDSILRGASRIAVRSRYALPQAAVAGSMGVAAVSGSGAANAVTTGSATIPRLINSGMTREDAASVETAASLGGQLMPPIMGISAFLMADFLDRSYFDVVARGYAPALVYFFAVALGVYLMSVRQRGLSAVVTVEPMDWQDWIRLGAFLGVVIGLIVLMSALHLAPLFAALYVFAAIGAALLVLQAVTVFRERGAAGARTLGATLLRFIDTFASMTAELTLLLATLSILTSAFVNTGVPPKVGFILVDAAAINLAAMVVVAFLFGALLGMGLPPAPTYILTALVIAPEMIKAGVDPWPVHFFAFFLAVWGELTPPTSVVAAVTSRIAQASFVDTLLRAIRLCASLFVLMAAVFLRPEIVLEPGARATCGHRSGAGGHRRPDLQPASAVQPEPSRRPDGAHGACRLRTRRARPPRPPDRGPGVHPGGTVRGVLDPAPARRGGGGRNRRRIGEAPHREPRRDFRRSDRRVTGSSSPRGFQHDDTITDPDRSGAARHQVLAEEHSAGGAAAIAGKGTHRLAPRVGDAGLRIDGRQLATLAILHAFEFHRADAYAPPCVLRVGRTRRSPRGWA